MCWWCAIEGITALPTTIVTYHLPCDLSLERLLLVCILLLLTITLDGNTPNNTSLCIIESLKIVQRHIYCHALPKIISRILANQIKINRTKSKTVLGNFSLNDCINVSSHFGRVRYSGPKRMPEPILVRMYNTGMRNRWYRTIRNNLTTVSKQRINDNFIKWTTFWIRVPMPDC